MCHSLSLDVSICEGSQTLVILPRQQKKAEMKAKALSVRESAWMAEECHLVDERHRDTQRAGVRLPNLFRTKKARPFTRIRTGPNYQVYFTARELLMEMLDREAVQELARRAAGVKTGTSLPSYGQSREQSTDLLDEQYAEALTWISIVLQRGLSAGQHCGFGSDLELNLDGWQGVLKRNSFQTNLLSLSRLEEGDKMEALAAFCGHLTRRYQALYTPGQNLAVKKYCLSYQQALCPLHLALLLDINSGFICNMFLYCPEQLQGCSRRPVVVQVVSHLLRPFCSQRHLVQLDSSAWTDGSLSELLSDSGLDIHFVPSVKRPILKATSSFPLLVPDQHRRTFHLVAHLRGWTGPALFPVSDLRGSMVDVFLPGLWVTLHILCINTFVLHTLQNQGSGRQVHLRDFTRNLASQLGVDSCITVPVLSQPHTTTYQDTYIANIPEQRANTNHCDQAMQTEEQSCAPAVRLQRWSRAGVCGLDNSGNSCYLNAVLQCVCSTVPLVEYLLNQDTRQELARYKCRVAEVFVRLLEEMWGGRSSSCAPVEARSVLCSILPQFNNHCQQDAQELLLFLLNALHDNLKKMCPSTRKKRQNRNRNPPGAVREHTIVSHLFEGQLSYSTLCMHCDLQAHSTQTFTVLSIPIPAGIIKCSLQDCLSLFFEQTVLTGGDQKSCSVCGQRRDTAVFTRLDKPPEILVLHLKRFGCKGKNQVKLRTNVSFSTEKLDLAPFLSDPSAHNSSYSSYRLYAVVNHIGNLNMGHYTALCHSALTHTWHCFDDSLVREVQDHRVQTSDAYMLLYSRRPFQKPKIHGL